METIRVRPFTTHVQFTTGKPWLLIQGRLDQSDEFSVRFWGFGIALRTAAAGRDSIGPWALLPLVERDLPEVPSGFLMVTREYDGDGLDGGLIQLWSTPEVTSMRSRALCSLYFDPNGNLELASGPSLAAPSVGTRELRNGAEPAADASSQNRTERAIRLGARRVHARRRTRTPARRGWRELEARPSFRRDGVSGERRERVPQRFGAGLSFVQCVRSFRSNSAKERKPETCGVEAFWWS